MTTWLNLSVAHCTLWQKKSIHPGFLMSLGVVRTDWEQRKNWNIHLRCFSRLVIKIGWLQSKGHCYGMSHERIFLQRPLRPTQITLLYLATRNWSLLNYDWTMYPWFRCSGWTRIPQNEAFENQYIFYYQKTCTKRIDFLEFSFSPTVIWRSGLPTISAVQLSGWLLSDSCTTDIFLDFVWIVWQRLLPRWTPWYSTCDSFVSKFPLEAWSRAEICSKFLIICLGKEISIVLIQYTPGKWSDF